DLTLRPLITPRPPRPTLFPYTTLFRSLAHTPYNQRRSEAEAGMPKRQRHVDSEIARVHAFVDALESGRFDRLGGLLNESHVSLRSEEHTSELQSRFDLVCRLLLEKKKN